MNSSEFAAFFLNQPTYPIYYSHQSGNLYFYIASCCVAPFHWGYVITSEPLEPTQLGCEITSVNDLQLWAPLEERFVGRIESLAASHKIGNGEYSGGIPTSPIANASVRIANRVLPVKFQSPDAEINNLLQGKKYNLSIVTTKFVYNEQEIVTEALFADRCRQTVGGVDFLTTFDVEQATFSEELVLDGQVKVKRGRLFCLRLKETIDGKNIVWVVNKV